MRSQRVSHESDFHSLIINNVEHLSMCPLVTCISSLEKCVFNSSSHLHFFFIYWVLWAVNIFWILTPCQCKYFLPFRRLPFILLIVSFTVQKLLCWLGSISLFLLLFLLPWETDLRKYCHNLCQRMFCLCSLIGVLWCHVAYLGL